MTEKNIIDLITEGKATFCSSSFIGTVYQTEDGFYHLIKDGEDLFSGLNIIGYVLYDNRDYAYQTKDNNLCLIRN